jgi:hypothetical protein
MIKIAVPQAADARLYPLNEGTCPVWECGISGHILILYCYLSSDGRNIFMKTSVWSVDSLQTEKIFG